MAGVFEEAKIDTHCHVLDPARWPFGADVAYHPSGQEIAPLAQYLQVMDAYAIEHALLVGPNSGYATDNRCLLDALERGNGRFKGVAVVPLDIGRAALVELRARGIVGIAFNAALLGAAFYADTAPLLRQLTALDMLLSLQVEADQMVALRPMVEGSGVRVLVDHCGRPNMHSPGGIEQPGFQALLSMARSGRVAVKLSGLQKFSAAGPPFDDTRPYVEALLQAYTLDACLWASDWPFLRASQRLDVGPLLRGVERLLPSAADRHRLFQDAPRRWLGF